MPITPAQHILLSKLQPPMWVSLFKMLIAMSVMGGLIAWVLSKPKSLMTLQSGACGGRYTCQNLDTDLRDPVYNSTCPHYKRKGE